MVAGSCSGRWMRTGSLYYGGNNSDWLRETFVVFPRNALGNHKEESNATISEPRTEYL